MLPHEHVFDLRQVVGRGIVQATNDTGEAQTVDVECYDGVLRTGIEVHQTFGLATRAPLDGAVVMLLAVEGDPGHLVALPAANYGVRFGGLVDGETVLYGADGSRVAIRQGGTIQVLAATAVIIQAPSVMLTVPGGAVMIGQDVQVAGTLTCAALDVSGNATIGGTLNGHTP